MEIYQFCYVPCIYESGPITISLHQTIKGAFKALKTHKLIKWEQYLRYDKIYRRRYKFGIHERWYVQKIKIEE